MTHLYVQVTVDWLLCVRDDRLWWLGLDLSVGNASLPLTVNNKATLKTSRQWWESEMCQVNEKQCRLTVFNWSFALPLVIHFLRSGLIGWSFPFSLYFVSVKKKILANQLKAWTTNLHIAKDIQIIFSSHMTPWV